MANKVYINPAYQAQGEIMNDSILSICPDKVRSDERHSLLIAGNYEVVSVASMEEAFRVLELRTFGAILLDGRFSQDLANLSRLRSKCRVLSLKFPVPPSVLLPSINALLLSRKGTNAPARLRLLLSNVLRTGTADNDVEV